VTDVRVFEDADALGAALADEVLAAYHRANGRFLLGCPGRAKPPHDVPLARGEPARFLATVVVMMDEYVGAPPDAHYSCRRFALDEIAAPLGVPPENVWVPEPEGPDAYDARIEAAGGIDLFLFASGGSDGHVAFVPPGAPRDGGTSVVEIAGTTRRDNLSTFPRFGSLDDVPTHGVTVGLGTIASSRAVRLVLHGADKREATARLLALDRFDPIWPASIVHEHGDAQILVDREALP
jgi:glucosamine-6-phosphate deaminase